MSQKSRAGAQARTAYVAKASQATAVPPTMEAPTPVEPPSAEGAVEVAAVESVLVEIVAAEVPPAEVLPAEIVDEPLALADAGPETAIPAIAEPVTAETAFAETTAETASAPIVSAEAALETVIPDAAPPAAGPETNNPVEGMKIMLKSTEDFVAFGQANLEAFVKSGQIWSAGVQELTKQFATTAKASFDESVSTFKALSTVKSVKEAIELQSTFAKTSMEKAMAESNKLTDASIKLTEETLAPITARVTVAVETFGKAA